MAQDWSNSFTPGNTWVKDQDGNYVFVNGGAAAVPGQTTYGNHEGSSNQATFTQPGQTQATQSGPVQNWRELEALQSGQSNIQNQLGSLGAAFGGGLGSLGNQITGSLGSLGSTFENKLGSLGNQVGSLGGQFDKGFSDLNTNLGSTFNQGLSSLGNTLSTQFGGLNNSLTSLAQQMTQKDPELQALNSNFGSFLDMYKKQFERDPYQVKAYEKSPYVDQMVQSVTDQVNNNWQRNQQPGIASSAQSVGGYGGSRQGVVEANALNDINRNLASTTANIYQTDYENQQNRNLQEYAANNNLALGMGGLALNAANASNQNQLNLGNLGLGIQNSNQGYNLGLGNLGLNAQNSQNNFYTAQRGQDLQQYGLGASMVNQANQGFLNQGSGIYDAGSIYQQAPWGTIGNFNSATTPYTGFGATSTQSQSANPWAQALGGAMLGGQIGRLF